MNIIKVTYKPTYAPILTAYYEVNYEKLEFILNVLKKDFFIENYIRFFNNSYDYVDNSRINIEIITDSKKEAILSNYIKEFSNSFDILEQILNNYNDNLSNIDSISSISSINSIDDDIKDSINLSNILKTLLKNKNNEDIKKLILDNIKIIIDEEYIMDYIFNKILSYNFDFLKKILKNIENNSLNNIEKNKIKKYIFEKKDILIKKILNIENKDIKYINYLKEYNC